MFIQLISLLSNNYHLQTFPIVNISNLQILVLSLIENVILAELGDIGYFIKPKHLVTLLGIDILGT